MCSHPNWKSLATVDFKWKNFVRESSSQPQAEQKPKKWIIPNISGEEAKRAYEDVVSDEKSSATSPCTKQYSNSKSTQERKSTVVQHISTSTFIKYCESNDAKRVSECISDGFEVNQTDEFGWTPLMCACCVGAKDVVQILLEKGANLSYVDGKGTSALELAKLKKRSEVINVIQTWLKSQVSVPTEAAKEPTQSHQKAEQSFYCETCKRTFNDTTEKQHITSTVHLFNSGPKPSSTVYGIPECNKGFQILLREGWDKEKGLGPEGSGAKYPLKTVLKQDRKGLGADQEKPRVTHFKPYDRRAIEQPVERKERQKTLNRRELERQRSNSRKKERDLRLELSGL